MFGRNAIADVREEGAAFLVNSIFYTIQGEGPFAGRPAVFLRLAGCNLRCFFCDTEFESHEAWTEAQLAFELRILTKQHNCDLVVITGGEPMLQPLAGLILASPEKCTYQIETAGTVWPEGLEYVPNKHLVCSPKTPHVHPQVARLCQDWKYIIRAGETSDIDGLPKMSTQLAGKSARLYRAKAGNIYVQPCDEQDEARNRANAEAAAMIAMQHGYRLSMQLHKMVGLP